MSETSSQLGAEVDSKLVTLRGQLEERLERFEVESRAHVTIVSELCSQVEKLERQARLYHSRKVEKTSCRASGRLRLSAVRMFFEMWRDAVRLERKQQQKHWAAFHLL